MPIEDRWPASLSKVLSMRLVTMRVPDQVFLVDDAEQRVPVDRGHCTDTVGYKEIGDFTYRAVRRRRDPAGELRDRLVGAPRSGPRCPGAPVRVQRRLGCGTLRT